MLQVLEYVLQHSSCIEKQKYSVIPSLLLSFTGTVSFTHRVISGPGEIGTGHCAHSFHSHFFPHF